MLRHASRFSRRFYHGNRYQQRHGYQHYQRHRDRQQRRRYAVNAPNTTKSGFTLFASLLGAGVVTGAVVWYSSSDEDRARMCDYVDSSYTALKALVAPNAEKRLLKAAIDNDDPIFLGFDSSTQSLSLVCVNSTLQTLYQKKINYDDALPEYNTTGGFIEGPNGQVTAPTIMWVRAMDLLLEDMKQHDFPFGHVKAVSASGQQHGSVYWKEGALQQLETADAQQPLATALEGAFSVQNSPIWRDSSTTDICKRIEKNAGGAEKVAQLTGSRMYERFTLSQIAKISRTMPNAYNQTEHISLVSSFIASLLRGAYVATDAADAAGMNLMNIETKEWVPRLLTEGGKNLADKLGYVQDSYTSSGSISHYLQRKYGFPSDCQVILATGDNPSSVAGLRLKDGEIAVSLGTSDTLFAVMPTARPSSEEGHVFCNPCSPAGYMALICYKNGSLTREKVRDKYAGAQWDTFGQHLESTQPSNDGYIGIYFEADEITPRLRRGTYLFDANDNIVQDLPQPANHCRAVVEAQFLSMLIHSNSVGVNVTERIIATGGASVNEHILSVMADVFGVPVYIAESADSAALGAAYRALHGYRCHLAGTFIPYHQVVGSPQLKKAASPNPIRHATYAKMKTRYTHCESSIPKAF